MLGWKKRKIGEWCWLYDHNMKKKRAVQVLEVIDLEKHGFFHQEYYVVEASCNVGTFPMFASQAELEDLKENK